MQLIEKLYMANIVYSLEDFFFSLLRNCVSLPFWM